MFQTTNQSIVNGIMTYLELGGTTLWENHHFHRYRGFLQGGYPKMAGLFQGKSQSKRSLGVPLWLRKPPYSNGRMEKHVEHIYCSISTHGFFFQTHPLILYTIEVLERNPSQNSLRHFFEQKWMATEIDWNNSVSYFKGRQWMWMQMQPWNMREFGK